MFSAACPPAAAFCAVANAIEFRLDARKICLELRRPQSANQARELRELHESVVVAVIIGEQLGRDVERWVEAGDVLERASQLSVIQQTRLVAIALLEAGPQLI